VNLRREAVDSLRMWRREEKVFWEWGRDGLGKKGWLRELEGDGLGKKGMFRELGGDGSGKVKELDPTKRRRHSYEFLQSPSASSASDILSFILFN